MPLTPETSARFAFAADDGVPLNPEHHALLISWGPLDYFTFPDTYGDISVRALWHSTTGDSAALWIRAGWRSNPMKI